MKYLLDTNVCLEVMRRRGPVAARVAASSPEDLVINAVVRLELEVGVLWHVRPERERVRIDRFLAGGVRVLPFDDAAARRCARLRYETRAQPIGGPDAMIASVALVHDLTVVTGNVREFARVPGLRVEDWSVPA